jgi:hypothetical protein
MSGSMVYPRECPGCGTLTPKSGFHRDRSQPSGRQSRCKTCHTTTVKHYHHAVRKPRREAVLAAEREAEWKVLEKEWAQRREATKKAAAAGAKRQRKLLAELGVEDVSGEELSRRVRAAGGLYIRGAREDVDRDSAGGRAVGWWAGWS